jgi:hypothetical protein
MQSEAIEKAVQDYTSRLSRERLPAHLVAFELNNLALKVREMTLEEAAVKADKHSEKNSQFAEQFKDDPYERHAAKMAAGAGKAIAAELRRMKGYICK